MSHDSSMSRPRTRKYLDSGRSGETSGVVRPVLNPRNRPCATRSRAPDALADCHRARSGRASRRRGDARASYSADRASRERVEFFARVDARRRARGIDRGAAIGARADSRGARDTRKRASGRLGASVSGASSELADYRRGVIGVRVRRLREGGARVARVGGRDQPLGRWRAGARVPLGRSDRPCARHRARCLSCEGGVPSRNIARYFCGDIGRSRGRAASRAGPRAASAREDSIQEARRQSRGVLFRAGSARGPGEWHWKQYRMVQSRAGLLTSSLRARRVPQLGRRASSLPSAWLNS